MRRVVITGIGAVTPVGNSFKESWDSLKTGISGISPIESLDVSDIPYRYAGQLKGLDISGKLTGKELLRYDPFVQYAYMAAEEAVNNAGLSGNMPAMAQVIIGSSRAGISSIDIAIRKSVELGKRMPAYIMPATTTSMAASFIAHKMGINGQCDGVSNACASGSTALGSAYRSILHGFADTVIAGGSEAPICLLCLEGYGNAGALSTKAGKAASSPFDKGRDGFVLSEGACVMVLEDYNRAKGRGAEIYGEIIGYACTNDSYHQTIPSPKGESRTILSALGDARIKKDFLGLVSAHAPSTVLGDKAESEAIRDSLGEHALTVPVTAIKSMTGHMLAASGAFEAAATLMSIKDGIVPPTINLNEKDPECDLNIVTGKGRITSEYAIVNSFGFGGLNAVLVLKGTIN